jgi:5-methylcytosine-specific restriction endonuclease McrA
MPLKRRRPLRRKNKLVKIGGRTRRIPTMEELLDDLCRALVFLRDGYTCRRCRLPRRDIQWHHIVTRRKKAMRWDPRNTLCLCSGCHVWWHENSTAQEQLDFLHKTLGEPATALLMLRKRMYAPPPDLALTKLWLDQAMDAMLLKQALAPFPGDPTTGGRDEVSGAVVLDDDAPADDAGGVSDPDVHPPDV